MGLLERVADVCRADLGERDLRTAVVAALRSTIDFDAHVWLLTDPSTGVGSSPLAVLPDTTSLADLPALIGARYVTTLNRWTALAPATAVTMATGLREQARSPDRAADRWAALLAVHGIADVMTVVFRDHGGCWGFLDLWRAGACFEPDECAALAAVSSDVTPVLRRALLRTFDVPNPAGPDGPVILLLAEDLRLVGQTERTAAYLEALLPAEAGAVAVPAAAYNVAAQLLAVEAGVAEGAPQARVFVPGRSWMTVRAGRITSAGATDGATMAVSIEPSAPSERSELYGQVAGLTGREAEVLAAVTAGHDTRRAAQLLRISEHTLQDHLKAIFAKTGTNSRRMLSARASGASN